MPLCAIKIVFVNTTSLHVMNVIILNSTKVFYMDGKTGEDG